MTHDYQLRNLSAGSKRTKTQSYSNLVRNAEFFPFSDIFSHFQAVFSCFRVLRMAEGPLERINSLVPFF
jgi:hypothetical protein